MVTMKVYHTGLAAFVAQASEADRHGKPIDKIFYDAELKQLRATNAAIAIACPYDGGDKSFWLTPEQLSAATEKTKIADGKIGRQKLPVVEGEVPRLTRWCTGDDPNFVLSIGVEEFHRLLEYAKATGAQSIHMAVNHSPGRTWQDRAFEHSIRFTFDAPDDQQYAEIVGCIMPVEHGDMDELEHRITNLPAGKRTVVEKKSRAKSSASPASAKVKSSGSTGRVEKYLADAESLRDEARFIRAKRALTLAKAAVAGMASPSEELKARVEEVANSISSAQGGKKYVKGKSWT